LVSRWLQAEKEKLQEAEHREPLKLVQRDSQHEAPSSSAVPASVPKELAKPKEEPRKHLNEFKSGPHQPFDRDRRHLNDRDRDGDRDRDRNAPPRDRRDRDRRKDDRDVNKRQGGDRFGGKSGGKPWGAEQGPDDVAEGKTLLDEQVSSQAQVGSLSSSTC
jgi:hypothetical protein